MDYPFYNGEETLEITKDTEKETTVTCTMQNTKIQLIYGETFATIFKSCFALSKENAGPGVS